MPEEEHILFWTLMSLCVTVKTVSSSFLLMSRCFCAGVKVLMFIISGNLAEIFLKILLSTFNKAMLTSECITEDICCSPHGYDLMAVVVTAIYLKCMQIIQLELFLKPASSSCFEPFSYIVCVFSVYVEWHQICQRRVYFYCDVMKASSITMLFMF